ncbi:MAG: hypothetical protein ACRED5_08485 [Propylenella sp.]
MAMKRDEEWREFYTEVGFRHGYELGAKAVRDAAAPYLSREQISELDVWLATEVSEWKREYLGKAEPPAPPKL